MNGPIHATTAEQGSVGGIHDGIDRELSDVGLESFKFGLQASFPSLILLRNTQKHGIFTH